MKYLEIATYITFTLLAILTALVLSARLAGPRSAFPARPGDPPRKTSLAAVAFVGGGIVMLVQVRALITIFEYKIPALSNYLVDSNRLFFVVVCVAVSAFLMLDIFLAPSRWQLVLLFVASGIAIVLLTISLELLDLEDVEFLEVAGGIVIATILGAGLIHWMGARRFRAGRPQWLQPTYIAPAWLARILTSRMSYLVLFAIVGASTYLAWADLPIF